jgi:hypothetical protein
MPSNSNAKPNTSDQKQSARNRHANANKRRTNLPVEYRWSAGVRLFFSGVSRTRTMPQFAALIESKTIARSYQETKRKVPKNGFDNLVPRRLCIFVRFALFVVKILGGLWELALNYYDCLCAKSAIICPR